MMQRRPEHTAPGKLAGDARKTEIWSLLQAAYPDARCGLDWSTPFQLLVATILSAQCTDVRVNSVTPALFTAYPDAVAMAAANIPAVEELIHSTGFFRAKARALVAMARELVRLHGGQVPTSMEELVKLPGVGRKTANVVLSVALGVPGLPVDTHVSRLSRRLGLTRQTDPVKIEQELGQMISSEDWSRFSLAMIAHGRQVCTARSPRCGECVLARLCPSARV